GFPSAVNCIRLGFPCASVFGISGKGRVMCCEAGPFTWILEKYSDLAACWGGVQLPPAFQLLATFSPTARSSLVASRMAKVMVSRDFSLIKDGPVGIIWLGLEYRAAPISKMSIPPMPASL